MPPDFSHELAWLAQNAGRVAGVDEAGRGPLAGPVAAAAVILNPDDIPDGLDDSKKLSARARDGLYDMIMARALCVSVSLMPPSVIDNINIRAASLQAMRQAVAALWLKPGFVLIDGRDLPPGLRYPSRTIIGGDGLSLSIAAASIIAKVTRDRLMQRLDRNAPEYGFSAHAGYCTARHRAAIAAHGCTPWHRMSFAPMHGKPLCPG